MMAAISILSDVHREKTGEGQYLDVAMQRRPSSHGSRFMAGKYYWIKNSQTGGDASYMAGIPVITVYSTEWTDDTCLWEP